MTIVYSAKKIITMNPSRPITTHVAVRDGKILGTGDLDELEGDDVDSGEDAGEVEDEETAPEETEEVGDEEVGDEEVDETEETEE